MHNRSQGIGRGDPVVDRILGEGIDEVLLVTVRAWLLGLCLVFLAWSCFPTFAALPASFAVLLLLEIGTRPPLAAHNRACRAHLLQARDAYAVMAFSRCADPAFDDACARAFEAVDEILAPELPITDPPAPSAWARATVLNGALISAVAAAGFLLRPEMWRVITWLDSLSPR